MLGFDVLQIKSSVHLCALLLTQIKGKIFYEYFKKTLIASAALALPGLVSANAKLEKMMKDPSQWVQQSGDYAGHRYSELDQINKSNVGSLKVAWTFLLVYLEVTKVDHL